MIWICRTGQNSSCYNTFIMNERIYVPWSGYRFSMLKYNEMSQFREIVSIEKNTSNHTTISNWSSQLYNFCCTMKIGDYVILPNIKMKTYCLAEIIGNYEFDESCSNSIFYHSRKIKLIKQGIKKEIFPQSMQYSLQAYRTIFCLKNEAEFWKLMKERGLIIDGC